MSEEPLTAVPSCGDDYDPNSLSLAEALERVVGAVRAVTTVERVGVRESLDRVAAADIRAPLDIPPFPNSAMDGYAVRASDLPMEGIRELREIGTAFAGAPCPKSPGPNECVRIMTGAVLPEGADTVVTQEQVESSGQTIRIGPGHRAGENVREVGDDIKSGTTVVAAGKRLQPADLGVIASLGLAHVEVWRRLRVAFFSTGDELRQVGTALARGQIYDSNCYTLWGMLQRLGVELHDLGVVPDQRQAVRDALARAATLGDAVITSGGVSVGAADFVKETLETLGQVEFWKIAVRPGRPFAFGRLGTAAFFGLPGNPVSVMVTFQQLVVPALRRMMGERAPVAGLRLYARCESHLRKRPGRVEFQRGVLARDGDGVLVVSSTGLQGSHVLTSMSTSNCYIVLPMDTSSVAPGDLVEVEPFMDSA